MENEDLIREQMEDTRTSLTEKLEKLEEKVVTTVQEATGAVNETVAAVKETTSAVTETVGMTVEAVKDTVQDTVSAVKNSVQDGVSAVKGAFDFRSHTENHPWLMTGGAVVAGFVAGKLLLPAPEPRRSQQPAKDMPQIASSGSPVTRSHGVTHNGGSHRGHRERKAVSQPQEKSWLQGILQHFAPELDKVKGLAIGMALNTVKDVLQKSIPNDFKNKFEEVFDDLLNRAQGGDAASHEGPGYRTSHDEGDESHRERSSQRMKRGMEFDRQ